ncbi:zinc ribbon domain-containing protein [Methanoregula sp.]|uniref:zinc ribbon domain-containing protein n=1 Tax=Methanoregula sp. TaxID=2052170 RepID=UPI003564E1FC
MICPKCGTRLPKDAVKCHFCGYEFIENSHQCPILGVQNANSEDPKWRITSYQSAQISMLSVIMAAFAFVFASSSVLSEATFPKYSITIKNVTTSYPTLFTVQGFSFPVILIPFLFSIFVLAVIFGVFLFLTRRDEVHYEKEK